MAFPATKLPLLSEILVDGSWADETALRMIDDGRRLDITRGRANWASRVVASQAGRSFRNEDGRFSNRKATSVYYQRLRQYTRMRDRIRWVSATFTPAGPTAWTDTDTGQAWTPQGGNTGVDYFQGSGVGSHLLATVNVARSSKCTSPVGISHVRSVIICSSTATGAALNGSIGFGTDLSNGYFARLSFLTTGVVQLVLEKRVAGVGTSLATANVGTYSAEERWCAELQRTSWGFLRAAAWEESAAPTQTEDWQCVSEGGNDTALTDFGQLICRSFSSAGNTNVNAQIRYDNTEVNNYRFTGESSTDAPTWTLDGGKVLATFQVAGVLERLTSGSPPALSAMRRTLLHLEPDCYFPLEDASGSTQFASALPGGNAVAGSFLNDGQVSAAIDRTLPGSDALPSFAAGSVVDMTMPMFTTALTWSFALPVKIASVTAPGIAVVIEHHDSSVTTTMLVMPNIPLISLSSENDLGILLSDSLGTSLADVVGEWVLLVLTGEMFTGGWSFTVRDMENNVLRTLAGANLGVYGNPRTISIQGVDGGDDAPVLAGHPVVYSHDITTDGGGTYFSTTAAAICAAMRAHAGETTAFRVARTAGEEGVASFLMLETDTTALVGPQPIASTAEIWFRAAEADQGILYEPRDALGIAYRPRSTLFNQPSSVTLDYAGGHVAPPFLPVGDFQNLVNDSLARRDGGSSARVVVDDGPLGANTATGIGPRTESQPWNVYGDDQLPGIAGLRTLLGTWDEPRYPALSINLAAPDVAGDTALVGAVAALDMGDVATVENMPDWLPPDDVAEMIQGTTESFGNGREWEISFNCTPAKPWTTGVYASDTPGGAGVARYGADTLELNSSVTSTATSWQINSTPLFVTGGGGTGDFTNPIRLMIGGEEVWATACSGAASPQTLTVQRSKNGVVKAHDPSDSRERTITLLDVGRYVP